jgi:hypothetical protein
MPTSGPSGAHECLVEAHQRANSRHSSQESIMIRPTESDIKVESTHNAARDGSPPPVPRPLSRSECRPRDGSADRPSGRSADRPSRCVPARRVGCAPARRVGRLGARRVGQPAVRRLSVSAIRSLGVSAACPLGRAAVGCLAAPPLGCRAFRRLVSWPFGYRLLGGSAAGCARCWRGGGALCCVAARPRFEGC